jgi:hypothetical protein
MSARLVPEVPMGGKIVGVYKPFGFGTALGGRLCGL